MLTYSDDMFEQAVAVLKRGGVIAHATDTCYGFACDAFNQYALRRLYLLKKMPMSKPISILVSGFAEAEKYGIFSPTARALAEQYWPGALTLIVNRKDTVPSFLNPTISSIGMRLPADDFSRALVRHLGHPITTTSANISGQPPPYSIRAIKEQFTNVDYKPDFIIDSGNMSEKNLPSTIIDITLDPPKIIRRGALNPTI